MEGQTKKEVTLQDNMAAYAKFKELMLLFKKKDRHGYLDKQGRGLFDRNVIEVDDFFKSITI